MISPPITPMSSGMSSPMSPGMGGPLSPGMGGPLSPGMGGPISPGIFDPMSPGTPTPTSQGSNQQYYTPSSPTSPGIQDQNADDQNKVQQPPPPQNQTPTQGQPRSKTMSLAMSSSTNSTGSDTQPEGDPEFDPHADPNRDPAVASNHHPNGGQLPGQSQGTGGPAPVQSQAQFSIQATGSPPTGAGGHGNWDPSDPNNFPSLHSTSNLSGLPGVCRLNGCDKSVFVDPVTHYRSEYCSQKHREDATIFGQVNPCIMCLKMPRGPNDHFCSRACRDKALSP